MTFTNAPCSRCWLLQKDHAGEQCLFAPTKYLAFADTLLTNSLADVGLYPDKNSQHFEFTHYDPTYPFMWVGRLGDNGAAWLTRQAVRDNIQQSRT